MPKILIIVLICCLNVLTVIAQEENTGVSDTLRTETLYTNAEGEQATIIQNIPSWGRKLLSAPKRLRNWVFNDPQPKPKKALWMTFVLPGLGQAYNKKHWKLPLVYGGIGGFTYAIAYNTRNYRRYKTAYINRLDDDPDTIEEDATRPLSDASLQNIREGFRKDLDRSYIGLALFYVLTGIDAYVDAHLNTFDLTEDLSVRWEPTLGTQQNPNVGVGLVLNFGYKSPEKVKMHPAFKDLK